MTARRGAYRIGRRPFLQGLVCTAVALPLGACFGEADTGPVDIRYDRQLCELCRMIISDPRYAAEVRGGPKNKVFFFDDIGDAIHFLQQEEWKDDPKTEIWVMDAEDGKTWLDARKAHFLPGQITPMDYGYAALGTARENTVSFDEMRKVVIEKGPSSLCLPEGVADDGHDHAQPKG
ncbi:MAG: protein NosL [Hyphomicrobiales bacterium]|nr:MAG: protein NosL [Hyphomicrobiales bacterium]